MRNVLGLMVGLALLAACKTKQESPAAAEAPNPVATPSRDSVANAAEFESKGTAMVEEMLAIFKATATDCDQRTAGLNAWIDRRDPLLTAITAYAEAHPEQDRALDVKLDGLTTPLAEVYAKTPGATTCEKHPGFVAAMGRLP